VKKNLTIKTLIIILSLAGLLYLNINLEKLDKTPQERIVVLGTAKSGTTALYTSIKDAMDEKTITFFEPDKDEFRTALKSRSKKLLVKLSLIDREQYKNLAEDLNHFDKKIMIVRDPRDILISNLLYWVRWMRFSKDEALLKVFLDKVEQKEKDPSSVSLLELYELRDKLESKVVKTWENPRTWQDELRDYSIAVRMIKNDSNMHVFYYKDYIDGNLSSLNEYLGFNIEADADVNKLKEKHSVKKSTKHIARSKKYGNWKNWFTKEDVEVFRPIFQKQMNELGYKDDWELNKVQKINPENGSQYIKRIVQTTEITW
jgi:hypothetical protein